MIYYISTAEHEYALGKYLHYYASDIKEQIRIIPYERLFQIDLLQRGVFIFTDFDRLTDAVLNKVSNYCDWLIESSITTLNHPKYSLMRFALLDCLYKKNINDFAVWRLSDWQSVSRFPVFIRHEKGHDDLLSDLLETPQALAETVDMLVKQEEYCDDIIIVEFYNKPLDDNKYRKYSVYKVGDTFYAQHCFSSENWFIKFPGQKMSNREKSETRDFVKKNPHKEKLKEIFQIAKIDYGRIDYCIVDNKIQVFEINTNPTVISDLPPSITKQPTTLNLAPYVAMHDNALSELMKDCSSDILQIPETLQDKDKRKVTVDQVHQNVIKKIHIYYLNRYRKRRSAMD